jgi:hypothetical protein
MNYFSIKIGFKGKNCNFAISKINSYDGKFKEFCNAVSS